VFFDVCSNRRARDSGIVTVGSMASVIVLNSKSSCSASGFCESKAGAMTVASGAAVFEIDLAVRSAFFVAFTLWWRRPGAASQASHLRAKM